MFWVLLVLIITLVSLWTGLVFFTMGLGFWNKAPIRYVGLALVILSFIPAFLLWSKDPNDPEKARVWHGRYAIRGCTVGMPLDGPWEGPVLSFSEDQLCTGQEQANDTISITGKWTFVSTEDGDWIDLEFEDGSLIQIVGSRDYFRADSPFPVAGCR